jgi:hypothetical protein
MVFNVAKRLVILWTIALGVAASCHSDESDSGLHGEIVAPDVGTLTCAASSDHRYRIPERRR